MRNDSAPPLSVSLLPVWPARADVDVPVESQGNNADDTRDDAQQRRASAPRERPLLAGHLRIELDKAAGRFVQTLTDPTTNEILSQFPSESQLAFSRGVRAYEIARSQR